MSHMPTPTEPADPLAPEKILFLTDFPPVAGDDWYASVVAALAYMTARGGGHLVVPPRDASYDCGVLAVIDITSDDIVIELQGNATLQNTSTTGVNFFRIAGTTGTRTGINFLGPGKLKSAATAGHMFTFAGCVGIAFCDWTAELEQLNPAKAILYGRWTSNKGMFTNRFGGPQWQHGTGSVQSATSPTVPAVDIVASANNFNANEFEMLRTNSHHNFAGGPFFSFIHTAASNAAFQSRNRVAVSTIENADGGYIKASGVMGFTFGRMGFYDSDNVNDHLIELLQGTGSGGGRANEQNWFTDINVVSIGGDMIGVAGTSVAATITSAGLVATVNTGVVAHGLSVGQRAYISGCVETAYNGRFTVVSVADAFHYTYAFAGASSPATGTPLSWVAAMTIKVGPSDARNVFENIGGNRTSAVEVDLCNRNALILGSHDRCDYYRLSSSGVGAGQGATLLASGTNARVETPLVKCDQLTEHTSGAGLTILSHFIRASVQELIGAGGIKGLQISRGGVATIDIAAGRCRSAGDSANASEDINVTATLTASMAASGANGLDTGFEASDTWYSVWVIGKADGTVASLLSASTATPTLPSGYDRKRRVGWFYNDAGSNIRVFTQRGSGQTRRINWDVAMTTIRALNAGSATSFTDVNLAEWMPPGQDFAHLLCGFVAPSVGGAATDALSLRPNGASSSDGPWVFPAGTTDSNRRFIVDIPTDANRIIEYMVTDAADDADIWVLGYDDEL